jgi:hypothetical protein
VSTHEFLRRIPGSGRRVGGRENPYHRHLHDEGIAFSADTTSLQRPSSYNRFLSRVIGVLASRGRSAAVDTTENVLRSRNRTESVSHKPSLHIAGHRIPNGPAAIEVYEVGYPQTTWKSIFAEVDRYQGLDVNSEPFWNPMYDRITDTSNTPGQVDSDGADFRIPRDWIRPGQIYRFTIRAEFGEANSHEEHVIGATRYFRIAENGDVEEVYPIDRRKKVKIFSRNDSLSQAA